MSEINWEWDKPIVKPLPGPVATESAQMTDAELRRVVIAGSRAAHKAAGHKGKIEDCDPCCSPTPSWQETQAAR